MSRARPITLSIASLLLAVPAAAQPGAEDPAPEESPAEPTAAAAPREGRTAAPDALGINPSTPRVSDLVLPTAGQPAATPPPGVKGFGFHGYMRIPLRVGFASGVPVADGVEGGTKVHVPPRVPDSAYTDWQYTHNMGGPWTEIWLSYGDAEVTAQVVLAAYNVTDAGHRDLQAQLGISQSFVTLNKPDLFGDRGGLVWNVGAFASRYGTAGRYDAGKYDTYLFGATHTAGETLTVFYDVTDDLTLQLEHGVGAKLDVVPLVPGVPSVPYLPYPGPVQQGTTLLHHAHVGATYRGRVAVAGHYLTSWTSDAELPGEVDGRITIGGGEIKLIDSVYGNGYLGYARLSSRDPLRLAGAIEVLHSFEGWNLRNNYFGPSATGTGTIDTVLVQHVFSLAKLLWDPQPYWGQGPDLLVAAFGMYNRVSSDDPAFTGATEKLKLGAEVTYSWRSWLGLSTRYDLVQPNMADATESFYVISPKVLLRSRFASNEQLVIQYARYFNGDSVRLAYPNEGKTPDENVLTISATMWW